jgi:hypothetical protein
MVLAWCSRIAVRQQSRKGNKASGLETELIELRYPGTGLALSSVRNADLCFVALAVSFHLFQEV